MNYRNIAITQKGLALHNKCTLGHGGIEFTRFATGAYRHEENLDLTLLTGLTDEKQSFPFSNVTRYSESEIMLSVVITNAGLKESYYIYEIGLFANDPDEGEILYAVTIPENPDVEIDYMSAYDEESPNPHTIYFDQYLKASNTAECTITVDEKSYASLKEFLEHINNKENPHGTRREHLAIENVDNTSDMDKPVSRAQQDALDAQYRQLTAYTDEGIADLIDGAPQTLDTLREIAEAMTDNKDVVEALQEAVGSKASKAEFDSHESNYNNPHRVEAEDVGLGNVPNVSTNDQTPTYTPAAAPAVLTSGEKLSDAFGKLAVAVADYITHKADMIKRMTAVEAGVSSLNKNFNYFEIFNWNGLTIYKNNNNDIRFYSNTSWINGITENVMISYKADAQINGITNTSHLLLPVRITTTSYTLLGIGFFLVKPDAVTFIPLCTYSGKVLIYGCNYGI